MSLLTSKSLVDLQTAATGQSHRFDRLAAEVPATLLELLRRRAWDFGEFPAYRFLAEDGTETSLSYLELDRRARAVACALRERVPPGGRVLLMFPPGVEFIEAFFGCVYAGVLAVPMSPPKRRDRASRISAILDDCRPTVGLTTSWGTDVLLANSEVGSQGSGREDANSHLPWIAVDTLPDAAAEDWEPPEVNPGDLAFLQYTSGSTDRPRGVMVSHANLVHNLESIHHGFRLKRGTPEDPAGVGVSWLPMYHDMGLIGGVLESIWAGGTTVLMAPSAFLRRPEAWLRAISDNGASVSGAPNFAYSLCARKIDESSLADLDLSQWRVAFCGAEPIRAETIEQFTEKFASCGFRPDAFYPCYGLAEATLMVTGNDGPRRPRIVSFRRSSLQADGVAEVLPASPPAPRPTSAALPTAELTTHDSDRRRLVGCGQTLLGQTIAIVDPDSRHRCKPDTVGEIWVRGASIAAGYWGRERPCDQFDARLAGSGNDSVDDEATFLRTGDLGFVHNGELFVTGRLKDLLIIRGRNLDPADIEQTAQTAHPAILPDAGAAFSQEVDGEERLVFVGELDWAYRKTDLDELFRAVRRSINEQHGIDPQAIVLVRPTTLPRTTSGKIQRAMTATLHADGKLKVMSRWTQPDPGAAGDGRRARNGKRAANAAGNGQKREVGTRRTASAPFTSHPADLAEQIERTILEWLHHRAAVPEDQLDRDRPFAEYGVDSMAAVELSSELEEWLKVSLSPTIAWQYPTPAAIAQYLAAESVKAGEARDDRPEAAAKRTEQGPASGNGTPDSGRHTDASPPDPRSAQNLEQLLASLDSLDELEAERLIEE